MTETNRAQEYLRIGESLKAERSKWDSSWDELRRLVIPRRVSDVDMSGSSGITPQSSNRFSATACIACQSLAATCYHFITPSDKFWFAFQPRSGSDSEQPKEWCNYVTQIVRDCLSDSNFYPQIHEMHLDRCSLGTGALFCEERDNGRLNFVNIPCGTFAAALNGFGEVDTFARWFKFSAAQIIDRFGKGGTIVDEKILESASNPSKCNSPDFTIMHLVQPRRKYDPRRMQLDATQRPYESVYICEETKSILEDDGYYEFPYMVAPFLKWGSGAYGISPGHLVEHVIKDEIFGDRMLNTYAEVSMFPRMLATAEMVGEIDFRAGGVTVIPPSLVGSNMPREFATGGQCDFLMERMENQRKIIEEAYLKPMIQVVTSVDREMTATEVIARQNEQVLAVSPSFTLFVAGVNRMFHRIFAILGRANLLPDPPDEFKIQTAGGIVAIPPVVRFTGKIAVALERSSTDGMMSTFNIAASLAQTVPGIMDSFRSRTIMKKLARTSGVEEECLVSDEELKALDQQRAEQQKMQMQLEMAQMGAQAAKDGAGAINQLQGGTK